MDRLDLERLRRLTADNPFVQRLVLLEETVSTNDDVRRLAGEGAPEGLVVMAEQQRGGRGRLGRGWFSPRGPGLYMSVLFRPARPAAELTRWTLAAAAAACLACREAAGAIVGIKWPNDLIWSGRKVAGILAEARSADGLAEELVVGSGFNVNQLSEDFPAELRRTAASLRIAAGGRRCDRERLAAAYLGHLGAFAEALARGKWETVSKIWNALAIGAIGGRVRVIPERGGIPFVGTTKGIDRVGALRVAREDGTEECVHLGESVTILEE
jgi:BirA family transcriptional regulator, biotin operon repressor / biotin---[acetyl-CoA-carboxylase] ligase